MSNSVLWELTKKNNAFLVKRYGVTLSSDPYNPTGRNIRSHSGFINTGSVAISLIKPSEKKKNLRHVSLTFLKKKKFIVKNKTPFKKAKGDPFVNVHKESLLLKAGIHSAAKVIKRKLANRPGLAKLALRKLFLLHKANVAKKVRATRVKNVAQKK